MLTQTEVYSTDLNMAFLRVKRRRDTSPADALFLAYKRIRLESTSRSPVEMVPKPNEAAWENSVFRLVVTVATRDAPVQRHVREALARPCVAHTLGPSASTLRVLGDLRSARWSALREARYRILSSRRVGLSSPQEGGGSSERRRAEETERRNVKEQVKCWGLGDEQVVDLEHEYEDQGKALGKTLSSDPETILCSNVKMLEHLSMTTELQGEVEHRGEKDDYVYDLYYQETATTPGWIQDILYVRTYADEGELVPDRVVHEEEVYEDEDDENEEGNWRNEYPDEEESDEGCSDRGECYDRQTLFSGVEEVDDVDEYDVNEEEGNNWRNENAD